MRLSSNSAASTSLLRHLAIAMIGMATLGGCAYGPPAGEAITVHLPPMPRLPPRRLLRVSRRIIRRRRHLDRRRPGSLEQWLAPPARSPRWPRKLAWRQRELARWPERKAYRKPWLASLRSGTDKGPALRGRWSEHYASLVDLARYSACVSQNVPSVSRALNMDIYDESNRDTGASLEENIAFYHIDGDLQDRLTCAVHPSIGPREDREQK